jgi:hypothetical protein
MARVEPVTPSGQHRSENERNSYGGERRWETGAGESWTSLAHSGPQQPGDRETDPESARWRGSEHGQPENRGLLRTLTDGLGITRSGPKGYQRSDERIREDVCERLWQDARVDVGDVSVEVSAGVVRLEGTVPQRPMKHAIEDIVASCRGVKDVENAIRVVRDTPEAARSGLS